MFKWTEEKQNAKDWAKTFRGESLMYEGIATYKDESVFLSKDTLMKCMPELKGRPVIIEHKLGIKPDNMEKYAVGYVTKSGYNEFNGDFYCEFVTWDDEAIRLLKDGYTLSTSYIAKGFADGGTHINTPYDREITDLDFTHLAIVKNPRYEKVKVYQNSIDEEQHKEEETETEEHQNSAIIKEKECNMTEEKIEVEQGFFNTLLGMAQKAFSNGKEEEKDNAKDDEFEYEGEKYSKKELVNAFKKMKDNEMDEEDAEDAEDAIDEAEKENKCGKKEKMNSAEDEIDWFELMQERMNSAERGEDDKIAPVQTREKALERGKEIYG